jgi:3-phenylpropionate/trans-cinnamate dioxygenase ferredoxin component
MADVVKVATLEQLAPGHGMTVTVRSVAVALFNVEGTVYAIDDTCRHEGVRYDITTGHTMHDPAERVTCDPVQVVDGTILVDVT